MKDQTGGPAFPSNPARHTGGMTLRDYFAGLAMQGFVHELSGAINPDLDSVAKYSYYMADAMLKAREE